TNSIPGATLRVWVACLNVAAVCLLASSARAQTPGAWPPGAGQYRFHMIGNAHIDPVWLWPWAEGMSVVHSTFRSALDRMKETPEFVFTASSAQFYAWVAENDPQMLAEIRQRVKEGRWALVGGWWVEPDVNIPNGESLVRQGLYGQLLFRRLFGRMATVAYNPDSFGHPGTLPQILKLQDMENYVFMRPQLHEKKLPGDVFWWQSPDGTRVLTFRIPVSYNDTGAVGTRLRQTIELPEATKTLMAFYGVGDHGGGATKENIESILRIEKEPGAPKVLFSAPARYFAEVREAKDKLPVIQDDLQFHAVGCYTAESGIKKGNRAAEAALATAEKLATAGSVLWGYAYPKAEFNSSWQKVLFLQFHDSLAGTSLPEHYATARDAHGYALEVANQVMYAAAQKLAWQVPTKDPDSEYLLLFNPHAWRITVPVEYDLTWDARAPSRVEDETGKTIPHQWAEASTVAGRSKLVFQAHVPPFGYRQFRLHKDPAAPEAPVVARASGRTLENDHLRVTFSDDGGIALFDKDAQREVFRGGATGGRTIVLDDPSDTWSHGVTAFTKDIGAFGNASFRVLENGPLRARIRVRSGYGASSLETDWLLYAGSKTLEARVTLDWHEHLKMLKFSFPVDVDDPHATYEIPYGHMERPVNGNENPGQRWIDVTGRQDGREYGLAVINDAKYGYSVMKSDMRVSIVRGAVYAQHIPSKALPDHEYIWQDQGIQTFRMLLAPHSGAWQESGLTRLAEEFTNPTPVIYQGIHPGHRPQSASFLAVDAPNVVVSVVKKAEESDDLIIRCYETDGRAATATLDLGIVSRKWSGHFRPFEIKTLRVAVPSGEIREVNLLEE
ncbi:MAG: glycoside hydrolase family 38 C-terminal domain-containing protein, partial [Bryobacteraceae bacterium]